MRFAETPLTCQCEKENKRFQISHFYRPFSSDIMAVKGLNSCCLKKKIFISEMKAYQRTITIWGGGGGERQTSKLIQDAENNKHMMWWVG